MNKPNRPYQSYRIMDRIQSQSNQDVAFQYPDRPLEGPVELTDPKFNGELDMLFKIGYDIILETNQGYDDEGGDCYQAYLIRPEHLESFNKYMETHWLLLKDNYAIVIMKYIIENPSHIVIIWAGPH